MNRTHECMVTTSRGIAAGSTSSARSSSSPRKSATGSQPRSRKASTTADRRKWSQVVTRIGGWSRVTSARSPLGFGIAVIASLLRNSVGLRRPRASGGVVGRRVVPPRPPARPRFSAERQDLGGPRRGRYVVPVLRRLPGAVLGGQEAPLVPVPVPPACQRRSEADAGGRTGRPARARGGREQALGRLGGVQRPQLGPPHAPVILPEPLDLRPRRLPAPFPLAGHQPVLRIDG